MNDRAENSLDIAALPLDDLGRQLTLAKPDGPNSLHIGMVGDTNTVVLSGEDTQDRFCILDMFLPPEGRPQPHRHDFEETFTVLEGELTVTFRGTTSTVQVGETINIPSNAPHQVHNNSSKPLRLWCVCSPAGLDKFFAEVGVPVATRTTPPPKLDATAQAAAQAKAEALAPLYRIRLLNHA